MCITGERRGKLQREYWNELFADKSFIPTRSAENNCASSPSNSRDTVPFVLPFVFAANVEIDVAK